MKSKILLSILFVIAFSGAIRAQTDSTVSTTSSNKKFTSGFAVYAEFGVLSNSSITDIRKSLRAQGIQPFGSLMSSLVFAKRTESDRWVIDHRIILMNSTKYDDKVDIKRASLWGIGLGISAGRKIVNTTKWNVYIPVGLDAMLYQMGIKSNHSASLAKLVANPGSYQAVRLYTGSLNVNAGVGVDYKTNFMPKLYDKFYVSTKVSYHLPVTSGSQWKGENVQVNDLANLKPSQLYASIGIVMVPRPGRKWRGMH